MSKSKIIVIKGVANVIRHFSLTMIKQQSGVICQFQLRPGDSALMPAPLFARLNASLSVLGYSER
jgi:hypothetical protein